MRKAAVAGVLGLLLLGCLQVRTPGPNPIETRPSETTSKKTEPADQTPELSPYPETPSGKFWALDDIRRLEPNALGTLPNEHPAHIIKPNPVPIVIRAIVPEVVSEVPVYLVGSYSPTVMEKLGQKLQLDHKDCSFMPELSLVYCASDDNPTGSKATVTTEGDAIDRSKELAHTLLMSDMLQDMETSREPITGRWRTVFYQQIDGKRVYADKGLQVQINDSGQLSYLVARRRPLIASSKYPIITVEEALDRLRKGEGMGFNAIIPVPRPEGSFTVTRCELAYVQTQASKALEVMQPYFIFSNDEGRGLAIPAVASRYVNE